ncbi:glutaredoxin domain-containing cysteine-rich protein 1 [Denticeps clupeoides]|uniref:glutaredoxin domain-containing cysteine-rich protein 1 n=1 Tax=Denticeps clupeoides TaxID=299321 RepID=UPI0010A53C63|nr:glutaredoxin domain-containing cysteine-rich protein 1-like [Denticeps clupeoides]
MAAQGSEYRAERTVRFRVASAHSGRVLREVFREDASSGTDSLDSDAGAERAAEPAASDANLHLSGLAHAADGEAEPDDLLMYASATKEHVFSGKRVNIFSKNGTVRGVRNKVSAGQVLFNNLSKMCPGSLYGNRHVRQRP